MDKQFNFILPKTDIKQYGINGALLLADLRAKMKYFADVEMLNENNEFFTTLQDIQCTKEQLTYYFKFPTQNPNGLVNTNNPNYISKIAGVMSEEGYHFLLNPISTENIEMVRKFYKMGFTPKNISEGHMMGKIITLEQLEAIYEIYYK